MSHDFKIDECDKCVYVKDTEHGYVIVCLYVDDRFIVDIDDKMITFCDAPKPGCPLTTRQPAETLVNVG